MKMMGRKQTRLIRKMVRDIRLYSRRVVRWWVRQDRKYRVKWRLANGLAALLIISSVAIPVLQNMLTNRRYRLSESTLNLVGDNNKALASKLTYNAQKQTYEFNKDAIKEYNPVEAMQKQAGGADEKTKSLYALDVPTDPKKGVTYHDVNSQLSFKLTPQFSSLPGKTEQGRIVYPLDNGPQAVYTLKNNGLKEDIVVTNNKQDTLRFTYTLELPKSLEARQLPDGSGAIGIYSGDPTLFNNMSYGSDKDRELVEKARENAAKTNLVFGIPAPVITTMDGKAGSSSARFELRGNQLTVVAENLKTIKNAFSIDPSVTITSASDFNNGNDDGNIDFSTSGQISRAGLTGGSVGAWHFTDNSVDRGTSQNAGSGAANGLINKRYDHATVTYGGYMYVLGGNVGTSTATTSIEYTQINSDGTVGIWNSNPTALSAGRARFAAVAYNGYIYISGGVNAANNTLLNDVMYAPINSSTHQTGSWSSAGSGGTFTTARQLHAMVAYNGYMYIVNGCTVSAGTCGTSSPTAVTYCASINGDGALGAWNAACGGTTATGRHTFGYTVYNGYIYIAGGCTHTNLGSCDTTPNNVEYAPLNSNGIVGTWTTSPNLFTTGRTGVTLAVAGGYLYLTGGDGNSNTSDVQYAYIYANGSIGNWQTTTSFNVPRANRGFVAYNNYLYVVAGCNSGTPNCNSGSGVQNSVQFAKIDTPGTIGSFTADNDSILASPNGVFSGASAIYNGYMYILGGGNSSSGWTNEVRFAQLNADGSTGAWSLTNAFPVARANPAATAYNGYLYVAGGQAPGGATTDCAVSGASIVYCRDIQKATINSDGTIGTWVSAGGYYAGTGNPGRDGLGMAAYNGYMYVVGGNYNQNSNVSTEVDIAPINSDGTVGTWVQNATALGATGRSNFQLAQYGRYLYIAGGRLSGNNTDNSVIYTTLSNSGGMSAWGSAGPNFTTARAYNFAAAYNGFLYIAAGDNATAGVSGKSDVQYIQINPTTGALSGSWVTSPVTIPTARSLQQGGIYNGYLYIAGGCSNLAIFGGCNTLQRDVEYAQINIGGSGSTSTWADQGASGAGRIQLGGAAYKGYVYIAGGCTGNLLAGAMGCINAGLQNDVRYASVGTDGTIGSWASAGGNFSTARTGLQAVAYNGYLYILGGCSAGSSGDCTAFQNDVQYALICTGSNNGTDGCGATAGTIGNWHTNPNSFSTGRYGLTALAYNGYMYVLGGCSATSGGSCTVFQSDVQKALICTGTNNGVGGCTATTGTVGTWSSAGGSFTTGRLYQSATINNGYLYVMAGCSAMTTSAICTTFQADVQYRQIDASTGSLTGSWSNGVSLDTPRYGAVALANNGYLTLIGGCSVQSTTNCTTTLDVNSHAPLMSDGSVGSWETSPTRLASPRALHAAVISNGYVVVLNGVTQTNSFMTTTSTAPLQVLPRTARYSKVIDLGVENARINNFLYNGDLANGLNDISYKTATTALPTFTSSLVAPPIPETTCSGASAVKARYVLVTILLDDTLRATYGETSTANLTDLTVRYNFIRPDPNIRLRLGQTLQQGDLSPFDTCG